MAKGQKWKKPKVVYRVHIKWWERVEGDDGEVFTEEYRHYNDILKEELDADIVSDLFIHNDWLYWDKDSDWEIEKVEEVEIWTWKEFNCGRWRDFYKLHGYGDNLHL